mgnify:CR=1 FL=1
MIIAAIKRAWICWRIRTLDEEIAIAGADIEVRLQMRRELISRRWILARKAEFLTPSKETTE